MMQNTRFAISTIVIASVALIIGFLIGYFSVATKIRMLKTPTNQYFASLIENEDISFNQMLIDTIDPKRIENHLRL
jgi:hypothetical protein